MLEAKRRAAVFFILAFLLAAATGYMVLQKVKDLNSELGAMTKIYVAKEDILSRTVITKNQVTVMELPNKFVTDSHITSFEDLQYRVSVVPLSEGEIITHNMIKPASTLQNENNRMVTLQESEKLRFDQEIADLDRVDIIVSTETDGKRNTSVFMKDVVVRFAQGFDKKGKAIRGIGVEVTSEEAPKLIHMQNYAEHIRVLKANVGQNSVPNVEEEEPVTESVVPAEQPAQPAPAVTPPPKVETKPEAPKAGTPSGSGQ